MVEKQESEAFGFDPLSWIDGQPADTVAENKTGIKEVSTAEQTEDKKETVEVNNKIILDTNLNIQNVTKLYEQLLNLLNSQNTIEIDASAVQSIDTANLQLLIVLKKTAIGLQKEVNIDFPSDNFIEAAGMLGLSEMLGVKQAAAGFF